MASEAKEITARPAEKQIIEHGGKRYITVKEGLAYILVPVSKKPGKDEQAPQQVFYNPIQQYNRDLTILALKAYGKEMLERKKAAVRAKKELLSKKRKHRETGTGGDAEDIRDTKAQKQTVAATPAASIVSTSGNPTESSSTADGPGPTTNLAPVNGNGNREASEDENPAPGAETNPAHGSEIGSEPQASDRAGAQPEEEPQKGTYHAADGPGPRFTILDALSASGLRALRYAREIPFVTSVTSNDISRSAIESITLNVQHNGLREKIRISQDDAIAHMYDILVRDMRRKYTHTRGLGPKSEKYDVVDLDPYGSAAPFLDAAVQAVRDDGGLLCVTCTDSGVWASNGYPEKCYSLYGGIPVKGFFSHEVGLRLVLHAIESSAARYGLAIEPLLSLSIDFYIRVFVRVRKSPASVKFQGGKNMVVYNCDQGCGAWATQLLMKNKKAPNKRGSGFFYKHVFAAGPPVGRECEHCGSAMHLAGPMYAGRIHSRDFIDHVLKEVSEAPKDVYGTIGRLQGMLQTALEELLPSPEETEAEHEQMGLDKEGEPTGESESKRAAMPTKEAELAALEPYPFYFSPSNLAAVLHTQTPPETALRGALVGLGYHVTKSHAKPASLKTDAPWSVIWHVLREWVRQKAPIKEENLKPGTAGYRLMGLHKKRKDEGGADEVPTGTQSSKPGKAGAEKMPEVVFNDNLGRASAGTRIVRYQLNPRENWGPMTRAKG